MRTGELTEKEMIGLVTSLYENNAIKHNEDVEIVGVFRKEKVLDSVSILVENEFNKRFLIVKL